MMVEDKIAIIMFIVGQVGNTFNMIADPPDDKWKYHTYSTFIWVPAAVYGLIRLIIIIIKL